MVDKITASSPVSPTLPTQIDQSTSIASEPDRALVAERQAEITASLEMMNEERKAALEDEDLDGEKVDDDEEASGRHLDQHPGQAHAPEEIADERLSGESIRIGTGNLEDDIPFGEHVGFL